MLKFLPFINVLRPFPRTIVLEKDFTVTDELNHNDFSKRKSKTSKRQLSLPPKVIHSESELPFSSHLKCRYPLHTDPKLLPLNQPLYIATDAKDPPPPFRFTTLFPIPFPVHSF